MTVDELVARFPTIPADLRGEPVLARFAEELGPLLEQAHKPSPCSSGHSAANHLYLKLVGPMEIYGYGLASRDKVLAQLEDLVERRAADPEGFAASLLPEDVAATEIRGAGLLVTPVEAARSRSLSRRERWILVALLALAAVPRLALVVESASVRQLDTPVLDARYYLEQGARIASGADFGDRVYYMSPLYTWWVAGVLELAPSRTAVRLAQVALDLAALGLLFVVARRVASVRVGLVAVALGALHGALVLFSTLFVPASLTAFLGLAAVAALLRARDRPSWPWALAAGALLGLCAIARPTALLFAPVGAAFLLKPWPRGAARVGAYALGTVLAIAPVTVHNVVRGGDLVLVTSAGGVAFYTGNNSYAQGHFVSLNASGLGAGQFDDDPTGHRFEDSVRAWTEAEVGRELRPSEVSRFWFRKGVEFIAEHPGRFVELLGLKLYRFWSAFETPQMENAYYLARYSWALATLVHASRVVMPLALVGLALAWRRGGGWPVVVAFLLTSMAADVLFFVTGRYRARVLPLLCLLAAVALDWAWRRLRDGDRTRLAAGAAVALAAGVFLNLPILGTWVLDFETQHANMAAALIERGELDAAIAEAEAAIAHDPTFPMPHYHLARAHAARGEVETALPHLVTFLGALPTHPEALGLLAELAARSERPGVAVGPLRRAVALRPQDTTLRELLGNALYRIGDLDGAAAQMEAVLAADPDRASAVNTLGAVAYQRRDWPRAEAVFRRALELDPRDVRAAYNLGVVLRRQERCAEAVASFARVLELGDPARSVEGRRALVELGECALELGDVERARSAAVRLLALEPDDPRARRLLARTVAPGADVEPFTGDR